MLERNLKDCVTRDDLARLLENAFTSWHAGQSDVDARRKTPRIPVRNVKPLFVDSYSVRDVPLNCRATITDVSADGFGIVMEQPVPVNAALRIAFQDKTGECNYGVALVACCTKQPDGYRVGLRFAENASELDARAGTSTPRRCRAVTWLKHASVAAYRTTTQRRDATHRVETSADGKHAVLLVEAKLFRYTAALFVDGRRVVGRTGALRDRLRNLVSGSPLPTAISLAGGGFSAWATLRPNAVAECRLAPAPSLPLGGAECV